MSSIKTLILLIISLSLIICQNTNKTEKNETNVHSEAHSHDHVHEHEHFNETNTNNTRKKPLKRDFNSKIPFNMTMDEMDTMMFCTVVVKEFLQRERAKIDAVKTRLNISANPVYEKIGTEVFNKCNKNASLSFVNTYMKNFTYLKNLNGKMKRKWMKSLKLIMIVIIMKQIYTLLLMNKFLCINTKESMNFLDKEEQIKEMNMI